LTKTCRLNPAGFSLIFAVRADPLRVWLSFQHSLAPLTIRAVARGVQAANQNPNVLPSADTAAMMFWALLASGQISMRKVDGWQTLATKPIDQPIDLPPER